MVYYFRSNKPVSHSFVQYLIDSFKYQRTEGYQFAVLVLSPASYVTPNNTPLLRTTGVMLTDSTTETHPPDHALHNYVTGRPDGHHHAEVLLLNRFGRLWLMRNSLPSTCQSIALYTWLLPCHYCTGKIIDILVHHARNHQVIVVYTSTVRDMDEETQREIIYRLESSGITVMKEKYDKVLSPA